METAFIRGSAVTSSLGEVIDDIIAPVRNRECKTTELPITIQGKVGKSLNGVIGGGEGRIYLRTNDGSITIR